MAILAFQKPDKVLMLEADNNFGKFEFRPLEPGYGVTIGNALRRILLSGLEGYAICNIRIDGVQHEFATIPGVKEDVTNIILNLKKVRLKRIVDDTDSEKAVVTAVFDSDHAEGWLADNEIDAEDRQLILQRRITADGKSSCRVNGYPVTASQMRELGSLLLEIHGQNDGAQLLDERTHLASLDRYADLDLSKYRDAYRKLLDLHKEMENLLAAEAEKEHLQIVLTETVEELEKAAVRQGEQEELRKKRCRLRGRR